MIDSLARLPGVGPKSAQRIAFHLLKSDVEEVKKLTNAIQEARGSVRFCDRCFN
ncbi:MAG: recombination protein RecR, partial [Ilumatobacteraceae bacterium]